MLDMRSGRAVPTILIMDIICLRATLVTSLEIANSAPGASVVNPNNQKPDTKNKTEYCEPAVLLL